MFNNHSSMLKIVQLLLCLTLFTVTVKSKPVRFQACGNQLNEIISKYCNGRYNPRTPTNAKRSSNNRG